MAEDVEKIRDLGKLCQVYVSPQRVQTVVRELGGTGFVLAITEERLTPEEARELS